jgi:ADP-ribosylglycohydrolase
VIATIITGGSIEEGITVSLGFLDGRIEATETINAVQSALDLYRNQSVVPSPEAIESLGGGWTGEEALAISLYCALVSGNDFAKGTRLAVNHSGDSDSTGSITGNILGALLGERAIPDEWLDQLELVDVVRQVGDDLFTAFEGSESWLKRYPP